MPLTARLPIAIVLTSFDPGGTERQMIELIRRLDRSRWQVHVACFQPRGSWFERAAEAAESVASFPVTDFRRTSTIHHVRGFARWCRERRIAVVHATELYANIFALPGAALAGVAVRVGNRREINPDKSAAQILMQRAAYACAHKVVANSHAAADRLRFERVPARKVEVIRNGLSFADYPRHAPSFSPRRVVAVANLRSEKGHDVLLGAAARVLQRFPDARFELVGGGPERGTLMAMAESRGVAHAVTFAGHRDDVPARLAANDIFVLPSRSEAFPNALLEAMATGMPVVASGVGGILELVDDGRTGLLVPPGDPVALANALCRVMTAAPFAAALGTAARAKVEAHYSFDRMVAAFEQLYLAELARRSPAAVREPRAAAAYGAGILSDRPQAGH